MDAAEFVVALSAYKHGAQGYADVLLPIAPFTETSGTFVNTEGRAQSFSGCVRPLGDARPAWKVLRVLGNLLGVPGFDYDSSEAVRADLQANTRTCWRAWATPSPVSRSASLGPAPAGGVERIAEVRIYDADAIARRAPALQKTRDGQPPVARPCTVRCSRSCSSSDGDSVRIRAGRRRGHPVRRARRRPAGELRARARPVTR